MWSGLMEHLATFAKQFSLEQVPNEVIERAKWMLLDSIAAIAYGNQHPNIVRLMNRLKNKAEMNKANGAPVVGTDKSLDEQHAAFVNAIAMVSYELDEGNPKAKGHPAAHFLPALLAMAITKRLSGKTFLEAFLLNYEISAKLGASLRLNEKIHPHGNWGVFGNGFGVGKLFDWDETDMLNGALLSSSFSFPTLWKSVLEGHEVRNVIIGLNNLHTTLLPDLVHAGYSASASTLSELYTGVLAEGYEEMADDLGDTYYIMHSYFKFYSYCRFCHAPIDAVLALAKDIPLNEIKKITVKTYGLAARLDGKDIENEFSGKFSIPYAIASELYEFYKLKEALAVERQTFVKDMMQQIFVYEDETYTKLQSVKRMTAVAITLHDGTVIEKEVDRAKGDADEEALEQKIIDKSKMYLQSIFGEQKTNAIIEMLLNIEFVSNLADLQYTLTK